MKNIWTKLFIAALFFYVLFSVGRVLFQSYQINSEIESLQNEISQLKKSNQEYREKILYYQSPSYREKIARERFGMQKPGEEVMVILPEEKPKTTEQEQKDNLPNYRKWWNYFFTNKS
jgi:cell division protein FtsB